MCILWAWALHVFWTTSCHLDRGVCHVFLWSMWWLAQSCKLGLVMLLILVPILLLFLCHVNLMLQRDPCLFWDTSVSMFCTYGYDLSIHAPVCIYGVVWHVIFLALLLLWNVSWQIVYMLFNFAKVVVVDPCMLWTCSCLGLFHKRVFLLMLCLSCHAMTFGEWIKLVKSCTCCYCFARLNLLFCDAM